MCWQANATSVPICFCSHLVPTLEATKSLGFPVSLKASSGHASLFLTNELEAEVCQRASGRVLLCIMKRTKILETFLFLYFMPCLELQQPCWDHEVMEQRILIQLRHWTNSPATTNLQSPCYVRKMNSCLLLATLFLQPKSFLVPTVLMIWKPNLVFGWGHTRTGKVCKWAVTITEETDGFSVPEYRFLHGLLNLFIFCSLWKSVLLSKRNALTLINDLERQNNWKQHP